MLIALASVTDSLATFATHVINDLGVAGVFLLKSPVRTRAGKDVLQAYQADNARARVHRSNTNCFSR